MFGLVTGMLANILTVLSKVSVKNERKDNAVNIYRPYPFFYADSFTETFFWKWFVLIITLRNLKIASCFVSTRFFLI